VSADVATITFGDGVVIASNFAVPATPHPARGARPTVAADNSAVLDQLDTF
jgi:hypothetical protein